MLPECVLGEGEELVVAVALAMSLCPSFLAFCLFWWFFLRDKGGHVVYCCGGRGESVGKYVQWGTMFGVEGGVVKSW